MMLAALGAGRGAGGVAAQLRLLAGLPSHGLLCCHRPTSLSTATKKSKVRNRKTKSSISEEAGRGAGLDITFSNDRTAPVTELFSANTAAQHWHEKCSSLYLSKEYLLQKKKSFAQPKGLVSRVYDCA